MDKTMKEKRPYDDVLPIARKIVEGIAPYCVRPPEIAGSLRRKRPLIGDIEIVALPKRQKNLLGEPSDLPTMLDLFLRSRLGKKLAKDGPKQKQFPYGGCQVDLFLPATPAHWGTIYLLRTGSSEFNEWIMRYQQRKAGVFFRDGLLINNRGLTIPTPEEADVFEALGMTFVEPTLRDDGRWM